MQKIGKEVKIGLAVIGVLLVAFGSVLVRRLSQSGDPAAVAATTDGDSSKSGADAASPHSDKPTIITASSAQADANPDEPKRGMWAMGSSRRANDTKPSGYGDEPKDASGPSAPADNGPDAAESKSARRNAPRSFAALHEAGGNDAGARDSAGRDAAAEADRRAGGFFAHDDHGAAGRVVQVADTTPAAGKPAPGASADTAAAPADKGPPADPFARSTGGAAPAQVAIPGADPFQHRAEVKIASDGGQVDSAIAERSLVPPDGLGFGKTAAANATPVNAAPTSVLPAGAGPSNPASADGNPLRRTFGGDTPATGAALSGPGQNNPPPAAPTNNGFTGAPDSGGRFGNVGRPAPATSLDNPTGTGTLRTTVPSAGDQSLVNPSTPSTFKNAGLNDAPRPLGGPVSNTGGTDKPGQYTVQPNDNYWTISEKVYGSGGYFKAIFENNRRQHPQAQRLQVGEVLNVPDVDTLQKNYPDLCPKPGRAAAPQRTMTASARVRPGTKVYVVEEGDTLFEVARRQLGKPSRWGEIYQLNRESLGNDFDYLKPGTELLIPSDGAPDPLTRQTPATTSR